MFFVRGNRWLLATKQIHTTTADETLLDKKIPFRIGWGAYWSLACANAQRNDVSRTERCVIGGNVDLAFPELQLHVRLLRLLVVVGFVRKSR